MKKVVILGCENSHAHSFLDFIKSEAKYSDVEVVGIYSDDLDAAKKLEEKFGAPIMGSYDEAVGKVDGVIVTARHGDNHYKYAAPYIKSGVPMFIDKPITVSEDEAVQFMRECRENGVKITGGSCCKHDIFVKSMKRDREENAFGKTLSGLVRAPISIDNPYGGFFFYSQHLVEMVGEIFGRYPKAVRAFSCGDNITVVFRYPEYDVQGLFTSGNYNYHIMRSAAEETEVRKCNIGRSCFVAEFDEFYEILCGGEQKISYDDFIAPVFVLNAINRSIETGLDVEVKEYKV